jgi:hypothetical protein
MRITLNELRTLVRNVIKEELEQSENPSQEQHPQNNSNRSELLANLNKEFGIFRGNLNGMVNSIQNYFSVDKNYSGSAMYNKALFDSLTKLQYSSIPLKMSAERMQKIADSLTLNEMEGKAWKGFDASIYDTSSSEDDDSVNIKSYKQNIDDILNSLYEDTNNFLSNLNLGNIKKLLPIIIEKIANLNASINSLKNVI